MTSPAQEIAEPPQPREPHGSPPWVRLPGPPAYDGHASGGAWRQGKLRVISTIDLAIYPSGEGYGPQWHVSVAIVGADRRPSAVEMLRVRRAFGMLEAEEDNHEPGNARHLWLVCARERRVSCECKVEEVQVTEADGHQWSNDADPAKCRGCEFAREFGRACPIHKPEGALP